MQLACGLVGEAGVEIVGLLLRAGAAVDARGENKNELLYVDEFLKNERHLDDVSDECASRLGGPNALHIVCSRDDNFQVCEQKRRLFSMARRKGIWEDAGSVKTRFKRRLID